MQTIDLKPLSVNQVYKGRRFSTQELVDYKSILNLLLPKIKVPRGKLKVEYIFGVSSKNSDGDNLIKPFQDILQDAYGFNDRDIYKWVIEKKIVKKGEEYIRFDICPYKLPNEKGVDNLS